MPALKYAPADNRKTLCFTALQHYLIDLYIEYRNDYLTVQRMAEHYSLSVACLDIMLHEGKVLHEEYITELDNHNIIINCKVSI